MDNSETVPIPSNLWRIIKMMATSLFLAAVGGAIIPICMLVSEQRSDADWHHGLAFLWAAIGFFIWPVITMPICAYGLLEEDREAHSDTHSLLKAAKQLFAEERDGHKNTQTERDVALARSLPNEWFAKIYHSNRDEPYKLNTAQADFSLVIFDQLNGPKKAKIAQVNVPLRDTPLKVSIESGLKLVMNYLSSGHFSLSGKNTNPCEMVIFHHLAEGHKFSVGPVEIIVCTDPFQAAQVITLLQAGLDPDPHGLRFD